MSWDFTQVRTTTSRKPHACEQCRKTIAAGEPHSYFVGKYEGEFMAYREHSDCRKAWNELMFDIHDGYEWEGAPFFCDYEWEPDDKSWLSKTHPAVFSRIWSSPSHTEAGE